METCNRILEPGLKCVDLRCISVNNIINDEVILGDVCAVKKAKRIVCLDLLQEYSNYLCYENRTYWKDGKSVVVFNGCGGRFRVCYKPDNEVGRNSSSSSITGTSLPATLPTPNTTLTNNPIVEQSEYTRTYIAAVTGGICGLLFLIFLILIIYQCKNRTRNKRFNSAIHRRHVRKYGPNTIPDVDLDETIQSVRPRSMSLSLVTYYYPSVYYPISSGDLGQMSRSTEFLTLATTGNSEYARVKKSRPKPDVCDVEITEDQRNKKGRAPPVPNKETDINEMYYMDGSHIYNRLHEDLNKAIVKRREKTESEEEQQNIYNKQREGEYSIMNRHSTPRETISAGMSKNVPDNYSRCADFIRK